MKKKLFTSGAVENSCAGKKDGCHFTELPLSQLKKVKARKHTAKSITPVKS